MPRIELNPGPLGVKQECYVLFYAKLSLMGKYTKCPISGLANKRISSHEMTITIYTFSMLEQISLIFSRVSDEKPFETNQGIMGSWMTQKYEMLLI